MYFSSREEIDIGLVNAIQQELIKRKLIPDPKDYNSEEDYRTDLQAMSNPILIKGTGSFEERGKKELDTFTVHFLNWSKTDQVGNVTDQVFVKKSEEQFEKQQHPKTAYDLMYKIYLGPTREMDYVLQSVLLAALKDLRFYSGFKKNEDETDIVATNEFQIKTSDLANISSEDTLEYVMDLKVLNVYLTEFEVLQSDVKPIKEVSFTLDDSSLDKKLVDFKADDKSSS